MVININKIMKINKKIIKNKQLNQQKINSINK